MLRSNRLYKIKAKVGGYIAETEAKTVNAGLRKIFRVMIKKGLLKRQPRTCPNSTSGFEGVEVLKVERVND